MKRMKRRLPFMTDKGIELFDVGEIDIEEQIVEENVLDMDFVSVEVELSDSVILQLALIAHKRDITLNQLCNDILREYEERN